MGNLPTAGQGGSLGLALWPWLTEMVVGSYFFPVGSAIIRPFITYKIFVLLSCPYHGPLAREEGLFLGLLFVPTGISWLLAISLPSLGCMRLKENSQNGMMYHSLLSQVPP